MKKPSEGIKRIGGNEPGLEETNEVSMAVVNRSKNERVLPLDHGDTELKSEERRNEKCCKKSGEHLSSTNERKEKRQRRKKQKKSNAEVEGKEISYLDKHSMYRNNDDNGVPDEETNEEDILHAIFEQTGKSCLHQTCLDFNPKKLKFNILIRSEFYYKALHLIESSLNW